MLIRHQAIILTNGGLVYRHISLYASLSLDELIVFASRQQMPHPFLAREGVRDKIPLPLFDSVNLKQWVKVSRPVAQQ